jgi:hypothetical protein
MAAGINIPVSKKLRLNASVRREEQNLDKNTAFFSAPLEIYYQFGLDYRFLIDTTFSLDYRHRDREDRLPSPDYDYDEDSLRFGLSKNFDKLSLNTSAEFGQTDNHLENNTSDLRRYTASAYYRPSRKQSYGGYIYFDEDSSFTGEQERSITYGLNANYRFSEKTSLDFTIQTNDFRSSTQSDRDFLQARLAHIFPNDNEVSVLARHTRYKTGIYDDETAMMVQYRIPFGIPLAKKKSIGSLHGSVFDAQTSTPYSDCVLTLNGLSAVSDNTGNFVFPSVQPGSYYLNVDTARLSDKRVPDLKTPIEVSVKGAEMSIIDIPLVQPASLSGQLFVYNYQGRETTEGKNDKVGSMFIIEGSESDKETQTLVKEKPFPNAILELKSSDKEVKRTVTSRQGKFIFHEIRPGQWTLTIYAQNLPEYHILEKSTFQFNLAPEDAKIISARIIPQKRTIKIINTEQTVIEEEKE